MSFALLEPIDFFAPLFEAGTKAVRQVIDILRNILTLIQRKSTKLFTVEEVTELIHIEDDTYTHSHVVQHLTSSATLPVFNNGTEPKFHFF